MGIDGIENRISHFFQELPASPYSRNSISIGLHLSQGQAYEAGLEPKSQVYYIAGTCYSECVTKADNWVKENLPGRFL